MEKRKLKTKVDGLSPDNIKQIRSAMRLVWQRASYSRKLALQRALDDEGFSVCEQCKKTVPKLFVDHIEAVGDLDEGFIKRLWCSSDKLQSICKSCHDAKTKNERRMKKMVGK